MVARVAKVVDALSQQVNVTQSQVALHIVRQIDQVAVLGEHKDKAIEGVDGRALCLIKGVLKDGSCVCRGGCGSGEGDSGVIARRRRRLYR